MIIIKLIFLIKLINLVLLKIITYEKIIAGIKYD